MGTALTGNTISSSYLGLIKTTDSAAISGSAKVLTDGAGNDSPLYLSTSRLGIGITPTSTLHVSGDFTLTGAFKDTSGDTGTSGQILSSTATGTNWIDNDTGDITSVVAGDGLTGGGTSGAVTINAGAGNLIDVQADQIDVDLSELATSTSDADGDFFAVIDDANAQNKLTKGNINLSGFNNDIVSGTVGKIAKFTSTTAVGDSIVSESSSTLLIDPTGSGSHVGNIALTLFGVSGQDEQVYIYAAGSSAENATIKLIPVGAGYGHIISSGNGLRLGTTSDTDSITITTSLVEITEDVQLTGTAPNIVFNDSAVTKNIAKILGNVDSAGTNGGKLEFQTVADSGASYITALAIDDSQQVGIGTTTPSALLNLESSSTSAFLIANRTNAVDGTKNLIDFKLDASDDNSYSAGSIGVEAEGTWSSTAGTRDASIIFRPSNNGTDTTAVTIASNGDTTFTGNIGVGTSTINRQLVLKDDTLACLQLANATTGVATNDGVQIQLASSTGYIGNYDGDLVFFTTASGTERVRIASGGDTTFAGNVIIHNSSNAPYIDFVESGATTDSKARITMDQVDTNNASLIFSTEGGGTLTERMRIDSDGDVGINNTNPSSKLTIDNNISTTYATTGYAATPANSILYLNNTNGGSNTASLINFRTGSGDGVLGFVEGGGTNDADFIIQTDGGSNGIERFRISNAGTVGIGATGVYTPTSVLNLSNTGLAIKNDVVGSDDNWSVIKNTGTGSTANLEFVSGLGTAMTIAHNMDVEIGSNPRTGKFQVATNSADYIASLVTLRTTGSDCYGYEVKYENATPNGTGNHFAFFHDSTGEKCSFPSNGGIRNFQTNDINLSDRRFKEDIVDAPNSLDIISQLKVRNYKLKDRSDERVNTGLIAQEVEEVCKELVNNDGLQAKNSDDSNDMKGIYNADLMFMMLKSIQELKAEVDELKKN